MSEHYVKFQVDPRDGLSTILSHKKIDTGKSIACNMHVPPVAYILIDMHATSMYILVTGLSNTCPALCFVGLETCVHVTRILYSLIACGIRNGNDTTIGIIGEEINELSDGCTGDGVQHEGVHLALACLVDCKQSVKL